MTQLIDMQSAINAALLQRLASVPDFGAQVVEGDVVRFLDSEDENLTDDLIIVQPGQSEVVQDSGGASVVERVTINIVLMTSRDTFPALLRAGRLAVKAALLDFRTWIGVPGVTAFAWLAETPMPAGEGHSWSCRVMPLQVTYNQRLK